MSALLSAPRVVAVVPARGGSKGVPGKNLRRVAGRSLVERAVDACVAATRIDAVYVSTDDAGIAAAARAAGAEVVDRPAELSGDTASSESALLHALDTLAAGDDPEVVVFVQCTSPFIDPADLDEAVRRVADGEADAVFAAVPTYEFLWRSGPDGQASGINHDAAFRPRRQDREPHYRETGAFYVMSVAGFRDARHRFFGRTSIVPVAELSAVEIDSDHDLVLAGALAAAPGDLPVVHDDRRTGAVVPGHVLDLELDTVYRAADLAEGTLAAFRVCAALVPFVPVQVARVQPLQVRPLSLE